MEEQKSSVTIPSNEEIIEELTKDLKSSCRTEKSNDSSAREDDTSDDRFYDAADFDVPEGENKSEANPPKTPDPPEHDEELALKDREVTLSEDDKQKLRVDAEALKNQGNDLFKASEYAKAEETYSQGIQTCPLAFPNDRAILYSNRAAARMKQTDTKTAAIADCTKAIELNPKYVRAYLRRAQLQEEEKKLDDALADFKKILELDPSNNDARIAVQRLPPLIEEANEKLKTEMLGKLKDLGNLVLKPFGLSTNNFELEKDPNSGGYSVKFNQSTS